MARKILLAGITSTSSLKAVPVKEFNNSNKAFGDGGVAYDGEGRRKAFIRRELAALTDEGLRRVMDAHEDVNDNLVEGSSALAETPQTVLPLPQGQMSLRSAAMSATINRVLFCAQSMYAGVCMVNIGLTLEESCAVPYCVERDAMMIGGLFGLLLTPLAVAGGVLRLIELREFYSLRKGARRSSIVVTFSSSAVASLLYLVCLIATSLGYGHKPAFAYCGIAAVLLILVESKCSSM
ncbi:hypothetical protein FOL47_007481 [Perkinsus chesapeaki]|uniref:Transmembrane protein n=1 Tax=Perkinsus chesapeaki TaxID=330153 RepID=A0A7J6LKA6_PERCH|nr:hypothetical protein FOL47_007481 [Perkinsus chesapeaki]